MAIEFNPITPSQISVPENNNTPTNPNAIVVTTTIEQTITEATKILSKQPKISSHDQAVLYARNKMSSLAKTNIKK